jgi:hypothetical protein
MSRSNGRARGMARVPLACVLVGGLAACSLQPRLVERHVSSAAEAGEVGVAVVATAPWEVFIRNLRPKFELDGKQALAEASATTREIEDLYAKSIQFAMKLAPEAQTRDRTTTTTADAAGSKTTDTATTKTAPGDLSKVNGPTIPASALPSGLAELEGSVGVNAMLRYQLATALFQEVQLLNQALNAAPELAGHHRFIVRTQINVRQFGRNTPYDTEVTLRFEGGTGCGAVTAVPLLVNDSMEVALASVARQRVLALGAALSLSRGNFSAGADYGKRTEEVLRSMGNEFNSLMTVGRGKDDPEVSVRIGAVAKGVDSWEMVPRTHSVTVLLLVPRCEASSSRRLELKSTTTFRHARTGIPLEPIPTRSTAFAVHFWPAPMMPPANQLAEVVIKDKEPPHGLEVTVRGGRALVNNAFARACIAEPDDATLPSCAIKNAVFASKVAVAREDDDFRRDELTSVFSRQFSIDWLGNKAPDPPGEVAGNRATQRSANHPNSKFIAVLATEKKAPVTMPARPAAQRWLCIERYQDGQAYGYGELTPFCYRMAAAQEVPADEPMPKLAATVKASDGQVLAAHDGSASLSLDVKFEAKRKPDRVRIELSGAGVTGVRVLGPTPSCATFAAAVIVSADCSFVLSLSNASPRIPIKLTAQANSGKEGTVDFLTVKLAPTPAALDVFGVVVPPRRSDGK